VNPFVALQTADRSEELRRGGRPRAPHAHGAHGFEHRIGDRDHRRARRLERARDVAFFGLTREPRRRNRHRLERQRGRVRVAHQVHAVEQHTRISGIGLARQLAIRAHDRILATGNGLHWIVDDGW